MTEYKSIGIIGYGNMGSAIAQRLKNKFPVFVFDKDVSKLKNLCGVNICRDAKELVEKTEPVILAVKPQDLDALLNGIKGQIKDKLVISIAAGKPTDYFEKILGDVRVIRVMPNLPARIGKGMTCLTKGKFATAGDLEFAQKLFDNLGQTMILPEEKMDAATAVVGSGPALYCEFLLSHPDKDEADLRKEFIDISIATAQKYWFTPEEAQAAVKFMVAGTDGLLHEMNLKPVDLEKQVASKGGTTEAGLKAFQETGSLEEAYKAAEKMAKELSEKE